MVTDVVVLVVVLVVVVVAVAVAVAVAVLVLTCTQQVASLRGKVFVSSCPACKKSAAHDGHPERVWLKRCVP